ncbi:hypothetical protein ACLOJK_036366 [Asimina triloba]
MVVHDFQRTAGAPDSVLHHPPQAGSHGCRRWVFRRNLHQLIGAVHHAVHKQIQQQLRPRLKQRPHIAITVSLPNVRPRQHFAPATPAIITIIVFNRPATASDGHTQPDSPKSHRPADTHQLRPGVVAVRPQSSSSSTAVISINVVRTAPITPKSSNHKQHPRPNRPIIQRTQNPKSATIETHFISRPIQVPLNAGYHLHSIISKLHRAVHSAEVTSRFARSTAVRLHLQQATMQPFVPSSIHYAQTATNPTMASMRRLLPSTLPPELPNPHQSGLARSQQLEWKIRVVRENN